VSLYNLIASNAALAISLIKQFVLNPVLAGVPIQCYRYLFDGEADVSKQVLVNLQQGKQNVSDNVAPGPHEWQLEGYVGGMPVELSSQFMPSIASMRDLLDKAYLSRDSVTFFDKYQRAWTVMIVHFGYEIPPDTQNRLVVRLHLRELNSLTVSTVAAAQDEIAAAANPPDGTVTGAPAILGNTQAAAQDVTMPVGTDVTSIVEGLR
jgi:hypothetical protein